MQSPRRPHHSSFLGNPFASPLCLGSALAFLTATSCSGANTSPPPTTSASPPELASPSPTATPAFELLTLEAIASCQVTLPNHISPPVDHYASPYSDFGNEDGTLFTQLWPAGIVVFSPNGPGSKGPDGLLDMKWPWYRTVAGDVLITFRRLDAPAPPTPTVTLRGAEDGYGEVGFEPGSIVFTTPGCWEVTANVSRHTLTFVTLAVRLAFDPARMMWSPSPDLLHSDTDLQGYPGSIAEVWLDPNGGRITIETSQAPLEPLPPQNSASTLGAVVHAQPATCVQGAADTSGQWDSEADAGSITWSEGGLFYRIGHVALGLSCFDMLRMAASSF